MPGVRPGKLYTPALLVTVERATLVSTLVAVTAALVRLAPLVSLTSPVISPTVWADAVVSNAYRNPERSSDVRIFPPFQYWPSSGHGCGRGADNIRQANSQNP